MQDLSKRIKFLKLKKRIWRSPFYKLYLYFYKLFIDCLLSVGRKNTKLIFINGMRRSGNHYLMKTLMDSSTSTVLFFNNQQRLKKLNLKHGIQKKLRFSKNVLVIVGFEDLIIEDYLEAINFLKDTYFPNSESLVLNITRDLRNLMASRLNHAHMAKRLRERHDVIEFTRKLWYNHHLQTQSGICHTVRYNYLKEDLMKLDLKSFFIDHLDESKKILNRYGGGSSFETRDFNLRYLEFRNDQTFLSLIDEFKDIDESIYGVW